MIAHFGSQLGGGANIAGMRLHNALRRQGQQSAFYFGAGDPPNESYIPLFQNRSFFWRNLAAIATSWRNRQQTPGGFVPSPRWIRKTPIQATQKMPKVVNLHWVLRWLDLPSFFASLPEGLPVVWTLHDLIPITGGCHYPGACDGFTKQCGDCPQQKRPRPHDATHKFFRLKQHWYQKLNLHLVGNSEWTTAQANRSALAKHARTITTIHYGIDTDQFAPLPKAVARRALGIPEGKSVIGFCSADLSESRKGAGLLLEAIGSLSNQDVILLVMGGGKWPSSKVATISLGNLALPRLQCLFYSALDLFVTPSLLETFGNTAMEAMACETPVVAYATSGLRDVVSDRETGLLGKQIGSVQELTDMLRWMLEHPKERTQMGIAARERVFQRFSDSLMAEKYLNLYGGLTTL